MTSLYYCRTVSSALCLLRGCDTWAAQPSHVCCLLCFASEGQLSSPSWRVTVGLSPQISCPVWPKDRTCNCGSENTKLKAVRYCYIHGAAGQELWCYRSGLHGNREQLFYKPGQVSGIFVSVLVILT